MGTCCTATEEKIEEPIKHKKYHIKRTKTDPTNQLIEEPEEKSTISSALVFLPNFANKPTVARKSYEMEMLKSVSDSRKDSLVSSIKLKESDFYSQFRKEKSNKQSRSNNDTIKNSKSLAYCKRTAVFGLAEKEEDDPRSQFLKKISSKDLSE